MLPGDLDTLEKLEKRRSRFLGGYEREAFRDSTWLILQFLFGLQRLSFVPVSYTLRRANTYFLPEDPPRKDPAA